MELWISMRHINNLIRCSRLQLSDAPSPPLELIDRDNT